MTETSRRWLITGASTGFGRALAEAVLAAGDGVIATARNPAALTDLAAHPAATVLALDVTDTAQVGAAVEEAIASGGVDVLVNNAGHGLVGALEELTDAEFRGVMETNLFGALAVLRAVLPHMRERGSGHIVQMSSMGGVSANPGHAVYATYKFALEGASEALAGEVAPFGIRVTIVEPGGYSTDWGGASAKHATALPAYDEARERMQKMRASRSSGGAGDPTASAAAVLRIVDADQPPLRVFFGKAPIDIAKEDYASRLETWEQWDDVSKLAQG
jgi:NAD(P)-dependent dehydrogenase (short-subunit alcohol dehydrogenase family)